MRKSKFLSLILRHEPEKFGVALDDEGWTSVDDLLAAFNRKMPIDRDELESLVADCPKQRFSFSDDGTRIRANHGHSVAQRPEYESVTPPEFLYHGTAATSVAAILREGLQPRSRQFVHLSPNAATARIVGGRHGKPVVLIVRAGDLAATGHAFHHSASDIWLTAFVPAEFIDRTSE